MEAQDGRERAAGVLAGVSWEEHGCDWPDAVAETVVYLRAALKQAKEERDEQLRYKKQIQASLDLADAATKSWAERAEAAEKDRECLAVRLLETAQIGVDMRGRAEAAESRVADLKRTVLALLRVLDDAERAVAGWKFQGGGMGVNIAIEDRARFPSIRSLHARREGEALLAQGPATVESDP